MKASKWLVMVIGALTGISLYADTVTLDLGSTADARIFNASWGYDNNAGADASIGIYQSRDRSLLKFAVPVGATISSASLTLYATDTYGGNPNAETMNIYRLTQAWTESGVTWNRYDGSTAWTTAGGDYDVTVRASSTANPGSGEAITWDVTSLAQDWANGTYANNGLLIINSGTTSGLHFGSKENGTVAHRPRLTTSFTTPITPPTGAWTWNGGDGTIGPLDGGGTWGDANKWWNGGQITWSDNNDAIFGAGTGNAGTVTISGSLTPKSLWFTGTGSGNYTLTGGTLDFGNATRIVHTDVNATIQSAISNGGLLKQGAGTLSLYAGAGDNGANVYYQSLSGGLNIVGGTVEFASQFIRMGSITIGNGATLRATADWATGANNPWFNGRSAGTITVNAGGTLHASGVGNSIIEGLALNGGTVTGSDPSEDWGRFIIASQVTAGGATNSTISADLAVSGTQTFSVGSGSTLAVSGRMHNRIWTTGGVTKEGPGTMTLGANNGYSGVTDIRSGMLVAASSTALGPGGWDGNTMTWIRDGATLALQGNIRLDEHMHLTGAGVGGLGALRSLSGNNALTQSGGGGGTGFGLDGNTLVGVDADTLTVTGFYHDSGSYGIIKVGAGTLVTTAYSSYVGHTIISNGTLRLSVTGGAARHFDASTLGLADSAPVTQWNDFSCNNANATVPSGNATPTYIADAGTGTGLGAVNFLAGTAPGGGAVDSQALGFPRDTNVRSVFSVFKGTSFLMTDSSTYKLHRATDNNPADPLLEKNYWGQLNYLGKVYVNGSEVNPTNDAMPTASNNGYNLIEIVGNGTPFELDSFNKDRAYHSGNQSHAETILFDYVVSETQRQQIEAYLNKKWFGIGNGVSNLLPTATSVILANNSLLDLGSTAQTVAGLSGTGAVSNGLLTVTGLVQPGGANAVGTLTVPGGTALTGTLKVDVVGDGLCDVLAVQGPANLSAATLSVTDTSSLDWHNTYTILTCSGTPEPFGAVSVAGSWSVIYRNGSVKLIALGTMIRFN